MKYTLADLIDIPKLQAILDSLSAATNILSAVLDTEGRILTASGWHDICLNFHRCNTATRLRCHASDTYISKHLLAGERYVIYRCANGMIDCASPIILNGEHLGNVFTGQLFTEPPDVDFFRAQAKQYGFNEEEYLEALSKVPVIPRDKLEKILDFLSQFAELLADSGSKRLQQLEAQEALRISEENHRTIFESVNDGILINAMDPPRIIDVNPKASEIYGYTREQFRDIDIETVSAGYPPYSGKEAQRWIEKAAEDGPQLFEWLAKDRSGKCFWVEVSLKSAMLGNEKRILAIVRDISERKQAEEERRQFHEEQEQLRLLKQSESLKDQFLSILSHELRTPINSISGFGSILEDGIAGPLNEKQHEYLRKILAGADNLLSLVNDILDISRIQAGQFAITPAPMSFQEVARETLENLKSLADRKHQSLCNEIPHDLPVAMADSLRITQVLSNLVNNAIKFTAEGGKIVVRASIKGDYLCCEVEDNGIGISREDIPKLFKRFTQLDMTLTRKAGGTGLGLSISKAIIEAHGGNIGVESEPGQGSVFWFTLPLSTPSTEI